MAAIFSNFLFDHRFSVASLVGLGSIAFLIDEITEKSKQASEPHWSVRVIRIVIAIFVLLIAVTQILFVPLELDPQDLSGKTYLVTGCTPGGIGYETAKTLLEWNASTVVCTMRTPAKAEALKASLKDSGSGTFDVVTLELTSLDSVRQAAEEIKTRFGKLDGIVLNAGIMPAKREITKDGFEEQYQVNHLSQFLLLRLLEDRLKPQARVVFVASSAYSFTGKLDREVYGQKPGGRQTSDAAWSQWLVYTDTKLMNILSANAFAKRLASKDVRVTSFCPGNVASGFQSRMPRSTFVHFIERVSDVFGRTPLQGAMRGLGLLTSKAHEKTTGKYIDPYFPTPLSSEVTEENADWLWNKSNELLVISN